MVGEMMNRRGGDEDLHREADIVGLFPHINKDQSCCLFKIWS